MSSIATRVAGIEGQWPTPPERWSYSALVEVERCPRQWSLGNASYATFAGSRGYPRKPALAAVHGRIVHQTAEAVLNALADAQCTGLDDPKSASTIRAMGGLSGAVATQLDVALTELRENPRAVRVLGSYERRLRERVPAMRASVQRLLGAVERISARPSGGGGPHDPDSASLHREGALPPGTYPEQVLEDTAVPFVGVVDLLEVSTEAAEITDFKSGSQDASHEEQVLIYAALWTHDRKRNPDGTPARRLRLVYPTGPVEVGVDEHAVAQVRRSLLERVDRASSELDCDVPEARPTLINCEYCSVRHLCDEYWDSGTNAARPKLVDLEVTVEEIRTSTTALVSVAPNDMRATFFGPVDGVRVGDRLRVLEVHQSVEHDTEEVILRCRASSETYVIAPA